LDLTSLAAQIMEEEGIKKLPPSESVPREEVKLGKLSSFLKGYEALKYRKEGKEWHEICEILGFPSPGSAYKSAQSARRKLSVESKDDLRYRQRMRIDGLLQALDPAIKRRDQHTPRAIEVAVKLLEREARLEGLDLEGATETTNNKAIIINVQPHPDDEKARKFAADQHRLLQASATDVPFTEEVHLSDRGDGLREDVERSVLGAKET
jgi:hypothetical protein